ncbi:hypothetical protein NM22_16405 [Vibrio tubiashii]|nr:hypothetical protein NM22_16405 [Vibrio tubiashii]
MNSSIVSRLSSILNLLKNCKWENEEFCPQKAQVCAELSSIVYEDVDEYELKNASRIHLFASESFRALVGKKKVNLLEFNTNELEGSFFISRGPYASVLGVVTGDVVVLAVRGTVRTSLWDWKANIDTRKYKIKRCLHNGLLFPECDTYYDLDEMYFHRGFFEAIVPQFESIANKISCCSPTGTTAGRKLIWCGHSLGGAMAAIGYAVSSSNIFQLNPDMTIHSRAINAYTFGMPRYCGLGVTCQFPNPYHIFRKGDIVPTLPMRKMGFSDSRTEYELTEQGKIVLGLRTDAFGVLGHIPKLAQSIEHHSIEGYAKLLAEVTGIPRPV